MTPGKLISRFITLAILVLIAAGGAHWYLENKVKNTLASISKKLYPIAVIKYEDTYSSLLNSSIGVEQITINPRIVRDEIKIERIVFQAPNLKFLLAAKDELEDGNIPKKMRISISGLSIYTNGSIAKLLDRKSRAPSLGARDNAYGCADVKQFKFSELAKMGYEQLSVDFELNYEYNSMFNELDVTALWSSRQMFELEITGTFDVENNKFKLNKTKKLFDDMSNINITYRDLGYNRSTIDYCNINRGDQNYVSAHIDAFKRDLKNKLGLIPSDALVEAYRRFMLNSGDINFTSDLQHPINPKYIGLYKPRDAILLLRPDITVNGQPVDIPYDDLLKAVEKPAVKTPTKKISVEKEIVTKPENINEFTTVKIPQLEQHVGDMVRIKTNQGVTRMGILTDYDIKKIQVEVSHRGGLITYPIHVNSITNSEVMELPPTGGAQ